METGNFREIIRKLKIGDKIMVYGCIGKYWAINLEKIYVIKLKKYLKIINPVCKKCGIKMKSEGENKGFQCRKCKTKLPENSVELVEIERELKRGFYEVTADARRHLCKPIVRMKYKII